MKRRWFDVWPFLGGGLAVRATASTPSLGCSAGVAEWDRRESAERPIARADAVLYANKAGQAVAQ